MRLAPAGAGLLCHVGGSQGKRSARLGERGRCARGCGMSYIERSGTRPPVRAQPQEALMSANLDANPTPNAGLFVDQLPDGPGVSRIDPADPAAPMYRLLAMMRSPVTLRDLMIHPTF
jgi:hypothetical protein